VLAREAVRPANPESLREAHRLLLDCPVLLRAREREEYVVVARHVELLERWHREHTGWPIYHGERAGVIRLRRRPSVVPSGVFEPWKSDVVLASPRDYACLAYLLWYARSPLALARGTVRQVLLSDLRDHLAQRSGSIEAIEAIEVEDDDGPTAVEPFDFARRRADNHSLRRALRALEDLGAVRILDEAATGDEAEREALVEFTGVVEALIVELDLGAVLAAAAFRPDARSLEVPVLDAERQTPLRRAWRTLLLGPALFRHDDPVAFHAVRSNRHLVEEDVTGLFGLALELSPSYARLVRPSGAPARRAPSVLNHQQRGLVQAGLLLCAAIREEVAAGQLPKPDEDGCLTVPRTEVGEIFGRIYEADRTRWGSGLAELRADTLLGRVLGVLRTAGLVRGPDAFGDVLVLPTAALYHAEYAAGDESEDLDSPTDPGEEQLELPGDDG
jgi:uncharacterized protein (TIGR02678 family)